MDENQLIATTKKFVMGMRPNAKIETETLELAGEQVLHYRVVDGVTDVTAWFPVEVVAWLYAAEKTVFFELERLLR